MTLDLPAPPAKGRWRKQEEAAWAAKAGMAVVAQTPGSGPTMLEGAFSAYIVLDEVQAIRLDPHTVAKQILAFARNAELVRSVGPDSLKRIVVCWGRAPQGCRLTLRELEAD